MGKKKKKAVEYRVYDLPGDFPVVFFHGDEWRISDVLSDRLHFHNCFEIGICHSDSGFLLFDEEVLPFRAGDVSVISRHVLHTTCSARGCRSLWTYLFLDLEKILREMLPPECQGDLKRFGGQEISRLMNRDVHPRIHFLATTIVEELLDRRKNHRLLIKSLLVGLFYELLRLQSDQPQGNLATQSSNTFVLKPALEYMNHHYMQHISMDELAEMCHLSTTHFRRVFVSVMGASPLSFLGSIRIGEACERLRCGNDSVLSIAESVGFPSISCFNRSFLQLMGISPKEYRNLQGRGTRMPTGQHVLQYRGWLKPEEEPEHIRVKGEWDEN